MFGLREEEEGKLWISFCSIQGGRLQGGVFTPLWSERKAECVPFWAEQDSDAREEKGLGEGHTAHRRAELKTDLTPGQVLASPDPSAAPTNLRGGGADRARCGCPVPPLPTPPPVFLSELPPGSTQGGEPDTPTGQKCFESLAAPLSSPNLPTSWLSARTLVPVTCWVDRGHCRGGLSPGTQTGAVSVLVHSKGEKNILKTHHLDKALNLGGAQS